LEYDLCASDGPVILILDLDDWFSRCAALGDVVDRAFPVYDNYRQLPFSGSHRRPSRGEAD
jgi:hypothetical protein